MKETIINLAKAFVGESQARNRYTFYSKIARKEGYMQISELFEITAKNEMEHAKVLFQLLNELLKKEKLNLSEFDIEAIVPTVLGSTEENLKAAIAGEHYEHSEMYPEFAEVAEKEGFQKIAVKLKAIARAEVHHEERYKKLLKEVQEKTVFKKEKKVYWVCQKCGYIHEGAEPPKNCPVCNHSYNYFELQCEEY
ncbi:MAG: rubrerythrin [Candidatus Heimdallarchaeaceae archaeon]